MTPQDILRRADRLKADRGTFEAHWQEVADRLMPSREFTASTSPGQKRLTKIFNTVPVHAAELMAASLHGMLTSPSLRWFALRPMGQGEDAPEDVDAWLEGATDRMYQTFTSPLAGFATSIHEVFRDVVAFGTGILFMPDRGRRGAGFQAVPLADSFIAENAEGKVDTLFRRRKLPLREACALWPKTAPRQWTEKVDQEPDRLVEIVHATYPRPDGERGPPVATCYVAPDGMALLEEGGFEEFPFAVARWSKRSGEVYGNGPGMDALPDVKLLNRVEEENLRGIQQVVRPALLLPDDGFLGPVSTAPGSINYYRSGDVGENTRIGPLVTGAQPDIGMDYITMLQDRIERLFYVPLWRTPTKANMTATEVMQHRDDMMRSMGPAVARLQEEALGPIIERSFAILARNGLVADPPQGLSEYRVEYLSPLALAQRASDADATMRWLNGVAALAQVDQSVLDTLDAQAASRFLADRYGAPSKVVRSAEEAAQRAADRQAQQADLAGVEAAQGVARAAKDGAGALAAIQGMGGPQQ